MIIQRFRPSFPIFGLLFAALFFPTSCARIESSNKEALQVLLQNAPEALDPRFALSAYAATVSELIYASLMNTGEDLKPYPLLAESVVEVDDVTFRVTLRPNLYFHDETALTAHDVVFTFLSLLDPKTGSPHREKFKYIKTVVAIDNRTVNFVLEKPYAPFLSDMAGVGIVPAHGDASRVGSGPFRLLNWDRTTNQITLAAHALWFEGAPRISLVKFIVIKDPTTRLLELLKGNADLYAGSVLPKQLDVLRKRAPELSISTPQGLGYSYLAMNLRGQKTTADAEVQRTQAALAHPDVRRAIAHAINIDEIIHYKFLDLAQRATGLLPSGHWAKDEHLPFIAFDRAKASSLLDASGFPDRGPKKGYRFSLVISTTTDRFRQSLAQIMASSLKDVGINASIKIQDWGSLFEDIKQGNFEMFSAKWLPVIEPDLMNWVFHSGNIPMQNKGGGNRGAYTNLGVDQLLTQARETMDITSRRSLYALIERKLSEDLPYIPLWFENEIVIQSRRVKGFKPSRTGSLFGLRATSYDGS